MTGEEEIYFLRDKIKEWKSGDNLNRNKKQRVIMLYDLSKINKNTTTDEEKYIRNYWQVFLGEFKIRRSSEKPFTYKYSIEFTAINADEFKNPVKYEPIKYPEIKEFEYKKNWFEEIMKNMMKALGFFDWLNGLVNGVLHEVDNVSKLVSLVGNIGKYGSSIITTGIMDSMKKTIVGFMDSVTNVVEGVHTVVSLPRTIQLAAVDIGLQVYNAAKKLRQETLAMVDECRKMFDPDSGYWDIPQETLDQFEMTSAEFKDAILLMLDDAENIANDLAVAAKSEELDIEYDNGDSETADDSEQRNKFKKNINNRIYARPGDRDNYGRDIALNDKGGILASPSRDYKLTDGVNNLTQAILMRLRERVNKRIRINAYGIRTNISDPNAGVAYILSSIDLTMRQEPRVKEVINISFIGQGNGGSFIFFGSEVSNGGISISRPSA